DRREHRQDHRAALSLRATQRRRRQRDASPPPARERQRRGAGTRPAQPTGGVALRGGTEGAGAAMRNAICAVALVCVGCYSIPETHHYALPSPVAKAGDRSATAPLIAVDALAIDAAYEEQSIVYRP